MGLITYQMNMSSNQSLRMYKQYWHKVTRWKIYQRLETNFENENENTLLPNWETDFYLLKDQQPPIVTNLLVQPIIEIGSIPMGLTNRPILESLKKATIPTLGIKPLVPLARSSLKLGKPPRWLKLQDIPSYIFLRIWRLYNLISWWNNYWQCPFNVVLPYKPCWFEEEIKPLGCTRC